VPSGGAEGTLPSREDSARVPSRTGFGRHRGTVLTAVPSLTQAPPFWQDPETWGCESVARSAQPVDYDSDVNRFLANQTATRLFSTTGDLHGPVAERLNAHQAMYAASGLEDTKPPRSPNIVTSAKSQRLGDCFAAVNKASNCRCVKPRVGDSAGTCGRRTYSAGSAQVRRRSRTPVDANAIAIAIAIAIEQYLGHDRAEEHGRIGHEPQGMYAEVA
jgi:hypothetical protein